MKKVTIDLDLAERIASILALGKYAETKQLDEAIEEATNPFLPVEKILPKLIRPIIFFDTETTGTDIAKDRIVSLDVLRLDPTGETEKKTWLINPTIPIPAGASEVHKITDEMVADQPTFNQLAPEIDNWFTGCDLAHFNGDKFDIPLIAEEFERAGIPFTMEERVSIDVSNIFRKKEGRSLTDALAFYAGEDHEGAHNSEDDVEATFKCFLAQMKKYPDYFAMSLQDLAKETCWNPNAVDLAGKLIVNDQGVVVYNFGKNKDKPVLDHKDYADWMLDSNFSSDTKRHLMRLIPALRRFEQNKLNL